CHNQGGAGGGGPAARNVDLIAAAVATDNQGEKGPPDRDEPSWDDLIDLHAGFRDATSVVLHRYGTDDGYEPWRLFVLGLRRAGPACDSTRCPGPEGRPSGPCLP